jgi:hypothetical protein
VNYRKHTSRGTTRQGCDRPHGGGRYGPQGSDCCWQGYYFIEEAQAALVAAKEANVALMAGKGK